MTILEKLELAKEIPELTLAQSVEIDYRIFILSSTKRIKIDVVNLSDLKEVSIHKQSLYRTKESMLLFDAKRWDKEICDEFKVLCQWFKVALNNKMQTVVSITEYKTDCIEFIELAQKKWWSYREKVCPIATII